MTEKTLRQLGFFANRLTKSYAHLKKWARRTQTSCYRLYDKDIPEMPVCLDWYDGKAAIWEYKRPYEMDPAEHAAWKAGTMDAVCAVLDIAPHDLFWKTRERQKGKAQYQPAAGTAAPAEPQKRPATVLHKVQENELFFELNMSDYIDVGLFLDHRETRLLSSRLAQDKHVLNLFAYTGSFSVYAAAAGAASTLSVDMSRTYCEWARRNMDHNNLDRARNRIVQADVLTWLVDQANQPERFDLIIVDPPTFSNSERMQQTFDIQRDHCALLQSCLRLCSKGGQIIFSTNKRGFKLDDIPGATILDWTARTTPEDFKRRCPHLCYLITAPV